jgi:hypothetical protein
MADEPVSHRGIRYLSSHSFPEIVSEKPFFTEGLLEERNYTP